MADEENVPLKCKSDGAATTAAGGVGAGGKLNLESAKSGGGGGGGDSKSGKFIYVLALLSALGGFLFGYDTGVVSGAMLIIRKEMQLDNLWHTLIVSGTIGAAWIFALVAGYLSDRVGRKPVILSAGAAFTLGSIVMGAAEAKETLLAGRIIVGVAIGLTSMSVPLYLAEVATTGTRGLLVTMNTMFITGGQAAASIFSGIMSNHVHGWRYMLGIAAIPAVIQFLGFLAMPESPRWLAAQGRLEEARRVLQKIRGPCQDIEDELESIQTSAEETELELKKRQQRGQSSSVFVQVMQNPSVRRALFLGCLLQMFQQIAGINTVMYYSATIIQMAGVYNTTLAIWLSALTATTNFLCTFIGVYLVERAGRRMLTLVSLAGVIVSLAFLGAGFMITNYNSYPAVPWLEDGEFYDQCTSAISCGECSTINECGFCFYDDPDQGVSRGTCLLSHVNQSAFSSELGPCSNKTEADLLVDGSAGWIWAYDWCPSPYGWVTVVGLIVYLISFAPGMGPMPWTINSEIYPSWARSTCNSIATSTNWFFNLIVSMTFLSMTEILTREGAFFSYCGWAIVGWIIFWFILPETRGRSLEEMEQLFSRPWSCSVYGRDSKEAAADPALQTDAKVVHLNGHQTVDCRV